MANTKITPGTPTQVAHPGRATLRTVAAWVTAAVLFLVVAIPVVLEVAGDQLPDGWAAWLAGALGVLTTLVTLVTRLMQLPQAQPFLELLGLGTGVEKEKPTARAEVHATPPPAGYQPLHRAGD